jgi:hypothetical protein
MNADNPFVSKWWGRLYRYVSMANTIIDRADGPQAKWTSEMKRKQS